MSSCAVSSQSPLRLCCVLFHGPAQWREASSVNKDVRTCHMQEDTQACVWFCLHRGGLPKFLLMKEPLTSVAWALSSHRVHLKRGGSRSLASGARRERPRGDFPEDLKKPSKRFVKVRGRTTGRDGRTSNGVQMLWGAFAARKCQEHRGGDRGQGNRVQMNEFLRFVKWRSQSDVHVGRMEVKLRFESGCVNRS